MGIKYLNRYLLTKCKRGSIFRTSLQHFTGKTVVIDTYIYLYKYLSEDRLIENFHKMIQLCRKYSITPIFIFDGKPPTEKQALLQQRREKKKEAENKYKEIIERIESGLDQSEQLNTQLAILKKQFLKVDQEHIQCIKTVLREYNVQYVDASGESDQICVDYVRRGLAWGVLTDDMDMFVYGVKHVLRELDLQRETVTLYIYDRILMDLHMTPKIFRQILVLSGTDYNIDDNVSLHETLKWYHEYRKFIIQRGIEIDFYDWLCRYTKYIRDYSKLMAVYKLFD
jgi:5'-3' exonuclease